MNTPDIRFGQHNTVHFDNFLLHSKFGKCHLDLVRSDFQVVRDLSGHIIFRIPPSQELDSYRLSGNLMSQNTVQQLRSGLKHVLRPFEAMLFKERLHATKM